jgi:threonyl-tRNA synthetase
MAKVVAQVVRSMVVDQTFYVEVDVPDDFDIEDHDEVRDTILDAVIDTDPVEQEVVDIMEEYIEEWKVVA